MNDSVGVPNFTPIPSHQKPKKKGKFFIFFIPFLVVLVAIVSLISYLPVSKKLQTTKTPAATRNESKECSGDNGQTVGTVNISYHFDSLDACLACQNGQCSPADASTLVGQPTACGSTQTCVPGTPLSCTIQAPAGRESGSCSFSVPVPDCSVYQIDCGNGAWPNLGSISGGIAYNCSGCGSAAPSATPTSPVNTPTPTTPASTPTPTAVPTATATPNPTITPTPPPGATSTPTPTSPVPTSPGMLNCGSKGCDNNSTGLNKCKDGLTCVKANNENLWYCSMPQLTTSCQNNPNFDSCCSLPTTSTPTPIKPTILQTGESRQWYLIPLGIILGGLFL